MCGKHWRLLPREYKRRIWATYREGQEIRKDPSSEYLKAAQEAVEWMAAHERKAAG